MNHRIIIDTNVLLSAAILPNSVSHRAFLKAQDIGFLVFSDDTLAELSGVVRRPKFDRYLTIGKPFTVFRIYQIFLPFL